MCAYSCKCTCATLGNLLLCKPFLKSLKAGSSCHASYECSAHTGCCRFLQMARTKRPRPASEDSQPPSKRRQQRERQRARTATSQRLRGRIASRSWTSIRQLQASWRLLCNTTFQAMLVCCVCGAVHLGYTRDWVSSFPTAPDLASLAGSRCISCSTLN